MAEVNLSLLRRRLLNWYRRNRRDLPWRRSRDPYAIWISETMLQQTQVKTVLPYYARFVAAFPTLQTLASAPLPRVLGLWSGLGYYRRAENLHKAARRIVAQHGGTLPHMTCCGPSPVSAPTPPSAAQHRLRRKISRRRRQCAPRV